MFRGVLLAIYGIGIGLALTKGTNAKRATQQVDRLLSNLSVNLNALLTLYGKSLQ